MACYCLNMRSCINIEHYNTWNMWFGIRYNEYTFISTKISMINTLMETCHYLPNTNVDDITEALSLCTTRLISKKYL